MKLSQVKPGFARHETFHPRFGWFKKAFDGAIAPGPAIFNDPAATVRLGVGKNMVKAIRFWGIASKVLRSDRDSEKSRGGFVAASTFGQALLSEDGWDPYLEDVASIWLLHWALLRPPCLLPVWWVAFNEFDLLEFVHDDVVETTIRRCGQIDKWPKPHVPSVKKDVDCVIRMYCYGDAQKAIEDAIDCPFRSLRLVEPVPNVGRSYRFMRGHKQTLPAEVIAFAALDYMEQAASSRTITLAALASLPGGPGRVFRISDDEICAALESVAARSNSLRVESPAGARQLVIHEAPGSLATAILRKYYRRRNDSVKPNVLRPTSLFGDAPQLFPDLVSA